MFEFILFLIIVVLGLYKKGILGLLSFLGLLMCVFIFKIPMTEPKLSLGIIILSIVTASSALTAAGGMNFIVDKVEYIISKHPSWITILAPIVTYFLSIISGTSYIVLAILPIVAKIAYEENIKPVYVITGCIIAANQGSLCSPISASTLAIIHILNDISVNKILVIMFLSTFTGVIGICIFNFIRQKLDKSDNQMKWHDSYQAHNDKKYIVHKFKHTKKATFIFLFGVCLILLLGLLPSIRPCMIVNDIKDVADMSLLIPILMFSIAAIIVLLCNVKIEDILKQQSMKYGFHSIIMVIGISWLSNTLLMNNKVGLIYLFQNYIGFNIILFGLILFLGALFMASHAASILALFPIGLYLHFSQDQLLSIAPMAEGSCLIPLTGMLAYAINCDKTKSTTNGKYIFDNSLTLPGVIAVIIASITSNILVHFLK